MHKKNEKTVLMCPNCGNTDSLKGAFTMSPRDAVYFSVRNNMNFQTNIGSYGCEECGYYGPMPSVKKSDVKKFKFKFKKHPEKYNSPAIGLKSEPNLFKIISLFLLIGFIVYYIASILSGEVMTKVLIIVGMICLAVVVVSYIMFFMRKSRHNQKV